MQLDVPIKSEGTFNLTIKLHAKVTATLKVYVKGK
jgi:ribosomal protein L9